jgi:hypothetical protein
MTFVAAGAFSLSFAASMMSVSSAKERVDDKYAPREVVLYQYDACPFCTSWKEYRPAHRKPCLSLFSVRVWVIAQVLDISGDSDNSCLFVWFSTFQYLLMMGWWWMAAFLD